MNRIITGAVSVVCLVALLGAFLSFTYAIFTGSRDWGMFGFLLMITGLVSGVVWGARVENEAGGGER